MPKPPPPQLPPPEPAAPPAALQAQILATEHWSLLATRSTAQSEVLTRISMFLTFVSATLVSLALVGQATSFASPFPVLAIALLSVALIVGVLTFLRVFNVANEDLVLVLAMNRLRAAYAQLAPGVERWFMTSAHDDQDGAETTYYFGGRRRGASVVLGSSMMFIVVVDAALAALLVATIVVVSNGPFWLAVVVGIVLAVIAIAAGMGYGYRRYREVWELLEPMSPSPKR